jgi:hypothetical protein
LQEGIGVERAKRPSALTARAPSRPKEVFEARFESLSYQHRMHPQIASFSREIIYEGHAARRQHHPESATRSSGGTSVSLPGAAVWADVPGREQHGENPDEVQAMEAILREFIAWARKKGPPARNPPVCGRSRACASTSSRSGAMSEMLREVTKDDRKTRFRVRDAPVEIVCGTVDRFQGRERPTS